MARGRIDYANKDYESIRRELLARVPQLTDRWTDFNPSDLGVVLLELLCGIGDMLAYYLDVQAAESFLSTARQRQSIIQLCKLIGYRLDRPVAATTTLRFSIATPLEKPLWIPGGTRCRATLDSGPIEFETADDVELPSGLLSVEVGARQGIRKGETFTATGLPFQEITLAGKQIAEGSIAVRVGETEWTEVRHFQESDSDSHHYQTDTDHLDATSILFGGEGRGVIPPAGQSIAVAYLETGGASGNLGANLVTGLISPIYQFDIQVSLSVTNPIPATGGADRESLDHARLQAPAELRSLWKGVTRDDLEALANGFPGVAKSRVLDPNDCPHLPYLQVLLVIAPDGGGLPTPLLKSDLAAFLDERRVATVEIRILDPVYRSIDIDATVYLYPGESSRVVDSRIRAALQDYLKFPSVTFGQRIHPSDLVALIDGVPGVDYLRLRSPLTTLQLRSGELPVLGNVFLDVREA